MNKIYYRGASFAIFEHEISSRGSFNDIKYFYSMCKNSAPTRARIIRIDLKSDLVVGGGYKVTVQEAEDFAAQLNLPADAVIEVLSKNDSGIDHLEEAIRNSLSKANPRQKAGTVIERRRKEHRKCC
jgi:tRNA U34 5-carboxymethylaminomethyl modifying GTPase MnmE/TrmE